VSENFGTPLYQAVRHINEEKIRLLLDHGADPCVKCFRIGITVKEKGRLDFYEIMDAVRNQQRP
jgi:hypothetical protein